MAILIFKCDFCGSEEPNADRHLAKLTLKEPALNKKKPKTLEFKVDLCENCYEQLKGHFYYHLKTKE